MLGMSGNATLFDRIETVADLHPTAPAILSPGREPLSFKDLVDEITTIGEILASRGLGRGDRIAISCSTGPELAVALLATACAATAAPLSPNLTAPELHRVLKELDAAAIIVEAGVETPAGDVARDHGLQIMEMGSQFNGSAGVCRIDDRGMGRKSITNAPGNQDVAFLLSTSGTTSRPKIVPQRHESVVRSAEFFRRWYDLTPDDRALVATPLFHNLALHNGLIAPILAGVTTIVPRDLSPDRLFDLLHSLEPTFMAAGPALLRALVSHAQAHSPNSVRHRLRFIRGSSAAIPTALEQEVESVLGVPVAQAWGMTETCSHALSNPLPPAVRKLGSVGLPVADEVEVRIRSETGEFLGPGEVGEFVVSGPTVLAGYIDHGASAVDHFSDGWLRTGDQGYVDADGFFWVTGRLKEEINRGGEKIQPAEIENAAYAIPGVDEAACFGIPHAVLGQDVGLAIRPSAGAELDELDVRAHLAEIVSQEKMPRKILFVDELPKGHTGKVQRLRLAKQLGIGDRSAEVSGELAASRTEYSPPRNGLEACLVEIWREILDVDRVSINDDFFDLGGDSLLAVELFLRTEKALGKSLPRSILIEASTIAHLAGLIDAAELPGCIVPIQPEGNLPPFLCVHGGGGSVFDFRELSRHLGADQPFYGIQQSQIDGDAAQPTTIEEMAAQYVREVRKLQPVGPYYLGGYSFGGPVAFVMSQQLIADGETVALLALLDANNPSGHRVLDIRNLFARHRKIMAELAFVEWPGYLLTRFAGVIGRTLKWIGLTLRHAIVGSYLSAAGNLSSDPQRQLEANKLTSLMYRPTPIDGDAVLFLAEKPAWLQSEIHDEWSALVKGNFDCRYVAGDHYSMLREPHVRLLACELSAIQEEQRTKFEPGHAAN